MPPKRKTAQEAEGETEGPAQKEPKGGLKVGDHLPDLVALETDESKPDGEKKLSLKASKLQYCLATGKGWKSCWMATSSRPYLRIVEATAVLLHFRWRKSLMVLA